MLTVSEFISGAGANCFPLPMRILSSPLCRANRAQYAEVSFQSVADEDIADVALPSMQGVAEDEGEVLVSFTFPCLPICGYTM